MSNTVTSNSKNTQELEQKISDLQKELDDIQWGVDKTNKEVKILYRELEKWSVELEKRVEERTKELKESQAQLIQSEKLSALGELTAGISHEMNQPLNGIKIIAQTILKSIEKNRYNEDTLVKDVTDIKDQVDKMAGIIDHMRVFTRRSDGVPKEMMEINAAVDGPFKILAQQMKCQNIEIVKEYDSNIPKIVGNPIALEQVFMNLIGNARCALEDCDKQDKILKIETSLLDADKSPLNTSSVIIKVADNAGGIPDDVKEKIFQPFFTTKEAGKGTGLGLSISTKIVNDHKGRISVESQLGEGTTFEVIIPVE